MSLPFQKPKNKSRRSREYLTEAEVNKIITAARNIGRHGDKEKNLSRFCHLNYQFNCDSKMTLDQL